MNRGEGRGDYRNGNSGGGGGGGGGGSSIISDPSSMSEDELEEAAKAAGLQIRFKSKDEIIALLEAEIARATSPLNFTFARVREFVRAAIRAQYVSKNVAIDNALRVLGTENFTILPLFEKMLVEEIADESLDAEASFDELREYKFVKLTTFGSERLSRTELIVERLVRALLIKEPLPFNYEPIWEPNPKTQKTTTYPEVEKDTPEWNYVVDEFRGVSSAPLAPQGVRNAFGDHQYEIVGVKRVQNACAWDSYSRYRESVARRSLVSESEPIKVRSNEHLTKHGTRMTKPETICDKMDCLNHLWSRGDEGAFYGYAVYTAERASYSHKNYKYKVADTDNFQLMLVKVAAGKIKDEVAEGTSLRECRAKYLESRGPEGDFESIRGPLNEIGDVGLMSYKTNQTYPAYIVTYREKKG